MIDLSEYSDQNLGLLIQQIRNKLKRRTISDDPFKAIKGQEHCKRAIIVAAVQGHTIALIGPSGCGKTMLVDAGNSLGVLIQEGTTCPCGNYTDPRKSCRCDAKAITEHQRIQNLNDYDLYVECPPVPSNELLSKQHGTTTEQAKSQLSRKGPLPDKTKRGPGCDRIIKQVVSETGMSAKIFDTCLSVSQSIAALSCQDTISVDHILEAMHYRCR